MNLENELFVGWFMSVIFGGLLWHAASVKERSAHLYFSFSREIS